MTPLLSAQNLSVCIAATHTVCTSLSLEIRAGEHWVILGRNGAGKSTLLATLAGLREPNAGTLVLGGRSYRTVGPRVAARLRAFLPQHQNDPFPSTVLETALIGRHPHLEAWQWESEADIEIARLALKKFDLSAFETRDVQTLSGGERQRLAMATLWVQSAPLLLLDEPLTHLDLNHQIALLDTLRVHTQQGGAVVSVLHDPSLAWRYADRVLLLGNEGQADQGSREEMLTEAHLTALFGYPLQKLISPEGVMGFLPA